MSALGKYAEQISGINFNQCFNIFGIGFEISKIKTLNWAELYIWIAELMCWIFREAAQQSLHVLAAESRGSDDPELEVGGRAAC
jgi:hypothetical protein